MSSKKGCFWVFFLEKKSFPGKTVDFNLYHVLQILKAIGPEVNLSYQSSLLKHPTRRQNFAKTVDPLCAHYLTLRLTRPSQIFLHVCPIMLRFCSCNVDEGIYISSNLNMDQPDGLSELE